MPSSSPPADGFLLLDKPPGVSSFQALRPVKRRFPGRKIGHAGTLDPEASGLLLVGVGSATRLLEFLEGLPKTYAFQARLGLTSDTYDMAGQVRPAGDGAAVPAAAVTQALAAFRGTIRQTPPAFSAVKVRGERAYRLARAGEPVALAAREVVVHALELKAYAPGVATLEMECSKGTYVRSLAHDLGQALGCGAVADGIRRLAIGPFRVEAACSGDLSGATLLPPEATVRHLPALEVGDARAADIAQGRKLPPGEYARGEGAPGTPGGGEAAGPAQDYRVLDRQGRLLAIATLSPEGWLCPRKVLTPR